MNYELIGFVGIVKWLMLLVFLMLVVQVVGSEFIVSFRKKGKFGLNGTKVVGLNSGQVSKGQSN
jgi:hypothetical protein